jgi:3-mercaptopyruvate sulfurtransferase SseA
MRLLSKKGFETVVIIDGGFSEWIKEQLPISEKIE